MKVGILSMQRIVNYGSFLQAYSLKRTLEKMGHEVVFIDYKVNKKKDTRKKRNLSLIWGKFITRINPKRRYANCVVKSFFRDFEQTYYSWLGLEQKKNYSQKVDILVIGSDEVFRGITRSQATGELCTELFGDYPYAQKIITFAASAGNMTAQLLKSKNIMDQAKRAMEHIVTFSVRDNNTAEMVKALVNKKVEYHIDPVFLYDYAEEMPYTCQYTKYILLYGYNFRFTKWELAKIRKFAKARNLKIMTCGTIQSDYDICIAPNPFELLSCVKNAEYVITDTFHGTVFSIKFNKRFATLVRNTNNIKVMDLLIRLRRDDRVCNDIEQLGQILEADIDYGETNQLIKNYRKSAENYFYQNLQL